MPLQSVSCVYQMLKQKTQQVQFIYIRESTGLSYQIPLIKSQKISEILLSLYKNSQYLNLSAFYKGRLLQINTTICQNSIAANQIIYLTILNRQQQQNGYVYLSYEDKIYRIYFNSQQSIKDFKTRVQQETKLQVSNQIILIHSVEMDNRKMVKDYKLRTSDFLCMAKSTSPKQYTLDLPQVIYPRRGKSIEKRRGSECINKNQHLFLQITSQGNQVKAPLTPCQKLFSSECHKKVLKNNLNVPSPLSEYSGQFKSYMEQWVKIEPQTIINQNFNTNHYRNEANFSIKESEQKDPQNNKLQSSRAKINMIFQNGEQLCESQSLSQQDQNIGVQNSHFKIPGNQIPQQSVNYSKITPRFAVSTEIKSNCAQKQTNQIQYELHKTQQ